MDGFEKMVNNGLNKVTDDNLVDIRPIDENFNILDDKLGNVGLIELEGYNDTVDGHKDVSNLIKYVFRKSKEALQATKETSIVIASWSNQTLSNVLAAIKSRLEAVESSVSINNGDISSVKTDISNLKATDTGLRNDIAGLQTSRYNLINGGNIPVVNAQDYPATSYILDDNTLTDGEKITVFIYGSILADQQFIVHNTIGDTPVATLPTGGTSEKKLYVVKSTWKTRDANNKLLIYSFPNKATSNNTNIDWIVLVRGHVDGLTEWIPSKSDVINMQLNTDVKNLKEAEILDRQDIVKLNQEITGEDALIDANNIKFAQLLGVDISTIKGGIV